MKSISSTLIRKIPILLFLIFAIFMWSETAHAQFWCGQVLTPPNPPPPDQPPPCCECEDGPCQGSPNYVSTGNYSTSAIDLNLPTRGFSLTNVRTYDSVRLIDGPFGIGWGSSFTGSLLETTYLYSAPSTYYKEVVIVMPNGRPYRFRENPDASYSPVLATHYKLVKNGDATFDLFLPQSPSKHHFDSMGKLVSQIDEFGNTLSLTYDATDRLERVTDGSGSGRYLEFLYGADGRISTLRDSSNRTVSYVYNGQGALTTVTDSASRQTNYSYVNSSRYALPLLQQIKDHWNRVITTISYDSLNRTLTYTDAGESYTYAYQYQNDPFKVSKTDSAGRVWIFTFNAN
ncbi:MAG: DUF6531 domain-containing protein, partial [Nitrososphaera sp.]|nr:DUF6531 domain-containing protein [Nitrososphaera sp.]